MPPSALKVPGPAAPPRQPGEHAPAPLGGDARRAITALLRERAHQLPKTLAPRLLGAARLLPALLHASFEQPSLDADAPGVVGLRYRRRWSSLARAFSLPPPCRAQRGRCLVDAVLAMPTPDGLDALVLTPGLGAEELGTLQQRLDGIQAVFAQSRAPVRPILVDTERLARDRETCHRFMAFGALLAGRLSPTAWAALEKARHPLLRLTTSALAASAPAPLATLALTLMTRGPCPAPLQAALTLLAGGMSPRQLARPEDFCVRWAGLVPGLGELLEEATLLARQPPGSEQAAPPIAGPQRVGRRAVNERGACGGAAVDELAERSEAFRWTSPGELSRLVEHGHALACACAAAIRASGLGRVDRFTQRLWCDALGPGMPRVLLPQLGAHLAAEAAAGRLRLEPVRVGRAYEVRLPEGARLGRGATPVQARVRALGLVSAADAVRPRHSDSLLAGLDVTWRAVGQRLARSRERAALVMMVVAGTGARPGPPMDLLNRGPARALEFDGALSVLLLPGQRPAARMLGPEEVIRTVLGQTPAGAPLEMLAAQSAARPVAARLAQISALLRDASVPGPIAIEAGGRVLLPERESLRAFPLERFAARPRAFTPDPDAPDISITTGERRGLRSFPSGFVQCRVSVLDDRLAALLYTDDAGVHLREVVPLSELEGHLRDARGIVRAATPRATLAMRLSDGVEQAVRRAGLPGPRVEIAVRGALPFVGIEIDGESFGGGSTLGWSAAAEAVLARCPPGIEPVLAVTAVTATARGARLSPLLALYARSSARRRLRSYLARTVASYRTAEVSRRHA